MFGFTKHNSRNSVVVFNLRPLHDVQKTLIHNTVSYVTTTQQQSNAQAADSFGNDDIYSTQLKHRRVYVICKSKSCHTQFLHINNNGLVIFQ